MECFKSSRMKTILSYWKNLAKKNYNHGDDEKSRLELHARLLVKHKLSADEHPPIDKKPCPQCKTNMSLLCSLPSACKYDSSFSDQEQQSSALTTQYKHISCLEPHCTNTFDLRFKSNSIPHRIRSFPLSICILIVKCYQRGFHLQKVGKYAWWHNILFNNTKGQTQNQYCIIFSHQKK